MNKTACIFGSTGLIGSYLLENLLNNENYDKVVVFNRKNQLVGHPKLVQIVDDYSNLDKHAESLKADEYYCCLGTTIKKAKTKAAFEYVDYQLPNLIAELGSRNKVKHFLVVSSVGASANSNNFYLKTKGRMEASISKFGIENLLIFRPSLLLGKRNETRIGESVSKLMMFWLGIFLWGPLKKYKAIHAKTVAKAMIDSTEKYTGIKIFESDKIKAMAKSSYSF